MKILIAGYPYIRKNYLNTFKFYPEKDKVFFLLPKIWKIKKGKVIFKSPEEPNIFKTPAFFHHSLYPIIGGLLKGLMPAIPLFLLKNRKMFDLVYNCSEPVLLTTLYNSLWIKFFGFKNIIFSWENISYNQKFKGISRLIKKIILKLNILFCDGIICGNKKGFEIFRKITKKPMSIIPMSGVDTNFFTPPDKNGKDRRFKDINLNGKIVFTFAGAIDYRKGIHLILESLKGVLTKLPNSFLIIAGNGEYEKEIDDLMEKLGLKNYVLRVSWLNQLELKELLSVSDIFLYPSLSFKGWEEQFGYSMAEASLMELPIISTRSGSIEEVVKDNHTGILIKQENTEELKNAMIKLGNDQDLRNLLGKEGREYIVQNFSHEVVANKFYQFFNKFRS
ncbi:MAG: group 1 glycosyl transferase [Parcubacteria group bacterium Gr01-1014_2]|nr:MAG: group 1 glycosyl transferase [Parcubacteria group bacterium Gr01-1014_2]